MVLRRSTNSDDSRQEPTVLARDCLAIVSLPYYIFSPSVRDG